MNIDANDLLLFAIVADTGSFSKAAEQMQLPKSTVSRRITTLENQVGERIFSRSTRKITLTAFGNGLLEYAHKLADEMDNVHSFATSNHGRPSGKLKVSMPPDFHTGIALSDYILEFMEHYPEIRLELDFSARYVDLVAERFDLAIRASSEPLPDDATLVAKPISKISSAVYASPSYLLQHPPITHPNDLLSHTTLILASSSRTNRPWRLHAGKEQWEGIPNGPILCNSLTLIVELAKKHAGIAVFAENLVYEDVQQGLLVRVLPEWQAPDIHVWGLLSSRRLIPTRTTAFIEALIDAFGRGMR